MWLSLMKTAVSLEKDCKNFPISIGSKIQHYMQEITFSLCFNLLESDVFPMHPGDSAEPVKNRADIVKFLQFILFTVFLSPIVCCLFLNGWHLTKKNLDPQISLLA